MKRVLNSIIGIGREEHIFLKHILFKSMRMSEENGVTDMFSMNEKMQFLEIFKEGNARIQREFFPEKEKLFAYEVQEVPKWERDNSGMLDDLIRFSGMIALYAYEENQKLREEVWQLRHPIKQFITNLKTKVIKFSGARTTD